MDILSPLSILTPFVADGVVPVAPRDPVVPAPTGWATVAVRRGVDPSFTTSVRTFGSSNFGYQ